MQALPAAALRELVLLMMEHCCVVYARRLKYLTQRRRGAEGSNRLEGALVTIENEASGMIVDTAVRLHTTWVQGC